MFSWKLCTNVSSLPQNIKKKTPTTFRKAFFSPQPLCVTDVSIRRLNTSHKVSPGSQLADKGLVQRLAEIGWVVVCVSYSHGDTDITAKARVSAVCRSDNEVVPLDELIVEQASCEYQAAVYVDEKVVCAVVDVREDLVTHNGVLLWVLVLGKQLRGEKHQVMYLFMHYSGESLNCVRWP